MTLFGYSVTAADAEVSVIVFADLSSLAKVYAHRTEWLNDFSWTELRVTRQPKIDASAAQFGRGALEFGTAEEVRLARNLGWFEVTTGPEFCCKGCGLYPWELLPESTLSEDEICAGCAAMASA